MVKAFGDGLVVLFFTTGDAVELAAFNFCCILFCCGVFGDAEGTLRAFAALAFFAGAFVLLGGAITSSSSESLSLALRFLMGGDLAPEAALLGDFGLRLAAAFFGLAALTAGAANSNLPSSLKPEFTIAFLNRVLTLL